jgi:hypothetical protein
MLSQVETEPACTSPFGPYAEKIWKHLIPAHAWFRFHPNQSFANPSQTNAIGFFD